MAVEAGLVVSYIFIALAGTATAVSLYFTFMGMYDRYYNMTPNRNVNRTTSLKRRLTRIPLDEGHQINVNMTNDIRYTNPVAVTQLLNAGRELKYDNALGRRPTVIDHPPRESQIEINVPNGNHSIVEDDETSMMNNKQTEKVIPVKVTRSAVVSTTQSMTCPSVDESTMFKLTKNDPDSSSSSIDDSNGSIKKPMKIDVKYPKIKLDTIKSASLSGSFDRSNMPIASPAA